MGYLMKSGVGQMKLLGSRVPLDEALKDPQLDELKKNKLRLAQEARLFAEQSLHLTATKNYTSYVELGRPYVTYVVSAAPRWELKHYQWSYPFMGKMPYKGFFNESDAQELESELQEEDLDTYLRGVSAYSTLGWFNDPILSSMLRYDDYTLVNTIIHETVHATLYIKNSADFNERLATFLGNKGAEQFYLKREGPESPTLKEIQKENADSKTFSKFITAELKELELWYKNLPASQRDEARRQKRIHEIQDKFAKNIQPQLLTDHYAKFPELKLNNARLLVYKTYMQDLSDFETLYELLDSNYARFIETCKSLEKSKDPNQGLKDLIGSLSKHP
ncbi:MAG: aminopeptidase [Bdellovibrio sp. ArHS]|uniref:aminopeptidase n=1 Tax=Bdellovibrio sp. ArHS TaxID=1569284 RepID=UPI000583861B|nr:aminopeptidase [Bdellovibrio sp. ArHS]KHD89847.1 MAG: aminopeptidase [Bdellovibrio sp. ArHS]